MCSCPAHRALVECTCRCDHTTDRLLQWRARAETLTAERDALAEAVERVRTLVNEDGPLHTFDCDRFQVYDHGARQGTCDCHVTDRLLAALDGKEATDA